MQSSTRRILAERPCINAGIFENVNVHVQCLKCDSVHIVAGVSLGLRSFTYTFHAHLIRSMALC